MVFYFSYTFLYSKEEKRFRTGGQQTLPKFSLVIMSSQSKFLFVTVIPKYLNFKFFIALVAKQKAIPVTGLGGL
jgi:hypothetical protein